MASKELSTVDLVQNPAMNSLLLWKFGSSYQKESPDKLPVFTTFFPVLPLLLHGPTVRVISSTFPSSGLAKFVSKIAEEREQLIAFHNRAYAMRSLTLEAISTAVSTSMLSVNYDTARVRANDIRIPKMPERIKLHINGAEKIGIWFSRLPDHQVFSILKVEA